MLCDSPHLREGLCVPSFKPSWEVASQEPLRESAVVCFQNWGLTSEASQGRDQGGGRLAA